MFAPTTIATHQTSRPWSFVDMMRALQIVVASNFRKQEVQNDVEAQQLPNKIQKEESETGVERQAATEKQGRQTNIEEEGPQTDIENQQQPPIASLENSHSTKRSRFAKQLTQQTELGRVPDVAPAPHDQLNLKANTEVESIPYAWRCALKWILRATLDEVNVLRLTRGLQANIPFLAAYEAHLLAQLISVCDQRASETRHTQLDSVLSACFRNRNVSRVLVQTVVTRYDFLWHQAHQFKWNRWYDGWGTTSALPIIGRFIGFTSFPATENFPNTLNHAFASVGRRVLRKGFWWTRVITGGHQGLVTNDPDVTSMNLAAESIGFETANRNQHGAYIGRLRTNEFRRQHRLPVDESVMRTFITDPLSTMLNNGLEHVLLVVANHYRNMLDQPYGNFAHQRMEQLQPFEMLRFHLPVVFVALTSLRGINEWDSAVLAPFVAKLQRIGQVDDVAPIRALVDEGLKSIVDCVCAGIATRAQALRKLLHAIDDALVKVSEEAEAVEKHVKSVEAGIGVGANLLDKVGFSVVPDETLKAAVLAVCHKQHPVGVDVLFVNRALDLLWPKDKRTLCDLCEKGHGHSYPASLLAKRTAVLLKRELQRNAIDEALHDMSMGSRPQPLEKHRAYWLIEKDGNMDVYVFRGQRTSGDAYLFVHRASRNPREVKLEDELKMREYVDAAEQISRAQKAAMTLELDHGRRFNLDAFMEFASLRPRLRQLQVLAQVQCKRLDEARLNVLSRIKHSAPVTEIQPEQMEPGRTYWVYEQKKLKRFTCEEKIDPAAPESPPRLRKTYYTAPPQSIIVVGGGPTGLMTTLHCLENVLASNGEMVLLEARDAFHQAGATFERAQIVRLDPRIVTMLRYHLGTLFENVWIPAAGETDANEGNTLPTQGFVEVAIKDFEYVMNEALSLLVSRGLVRHQTEAGAKYSTSDKALFKLGRALKEDDKVLRKKDADGESSTHNFTWKVQKIVGEPEIPPTELQLKKEYAVYVSARREVKPFKLMGINLTTGVYSWEPLTDGESFECNKASLPAVYAAGTTTHAAQVKVVLVSELPARDGTYKTEALDFRTCAEERFRLDISFTHVCEAIGKPHQSRAHLRVTPPEPYAVACLSGLKVSMGMHKFGTPRWHVGWIDDIRSHTDQNTRVVGDFTKVVNARKIVRKMLQVFAHEREWRLHFEALFKDHGFEKGLSDLLERLEMYLRELEGEAPFHRSHLQVRFFETGDIFYLGMELLREYDAWKTRTVTELSNSRPSARALAKALEQSIDRLWYDAALETIRFGDVYNPGGHLKIPRLHVIDSRLETPLGNFPVGEAFRLVDDPADRYEVLIKDTHTSLVRNVAGEVRRYWHSTKVLRGGNLSRAPDGNRESKVALSTFPVSHYVNHRAVRLSNPDKGYVAAFLGDEQATPHFMRYSGLTGAGINVMLFNNFIKGVIRGEPRA